MVFAAYWTANRRSVGSRNAVLIVANLAFYGSWNPQLVPLLLLTISIDYAIGLKISSAESEATKGRWLAGALLLSLLPLAYLKYSTFLVVSLTDLWEPFGAQMAPWAYRAILPVGISFYTFAKMSYLVDVYRGTIPAERNFPRFVAYLSCFPVMLAGPIERGTTLLPQLKRRAEVNDEALSDGVRQFLWGALKKVVVADNLALIVDRIYTQQSLAGGGELAIGTLFFSIQIYCDFSGYSDMAMGIGRLLGIELTRNFAYPYFSRDIGEF
ncbi:MAG: hypothetical protein NTV05_11885 [Acidobacteria bacterium]|nr:hypothetical protein [Acidobacteriota bacterium]